MVTRNLIPPDGGYGYVIMFAFTLSTMISIPIMQGFGLVFKDRFNDLGFSAKDISLIMSSGVAISMLCGLFNAPLLKLLGYRKVALMSAAFTTTGIIFTAYANSFFHYIITYSVITSYGMGLGGGAYGVAINSYFKKKRAKAVGNAMAFCGIGPILMPQLLSFLMASYGITGTITIVGGIAAHTFISAVLLQPIEWHMKEEIIEDKEEENLVKEEKEEAVINNFVNKRMSESKTSLQDDIQVETVYGVDTPLTGSVMSLYSADFLNRSMSISSRKRSISSKYSVKEEYESDGRNVKKFPQTVLTLEAMDNYTPKSTLNRMEEVDLKKKNQSLMKRVGKFLINMFDLSLLKDLTYVNIMIGMSFAVFAEINFSLLTPFIMQDFGLDTHQIATFMSVVSIADVCFRFIAPYVSEFFKQTSRIMYMWAIGLLILSRMALLVTNTYYGFLVCALLLGIAKGFRTVYWSLVIPDHVPIERLAAATGIQGTFNSIFMWLGGSLLGTLRDILGSFRYWILVINLLSTIAIIMWSVEIIYKKIKARSKVLDIENVN